VKPPVLNYSILIKIFSEKNIHRITHIVSLTLGRFDSDPRRQHVNSKDI
jgi:hypothetical protein